LQAVYLISTYAKYISRDNPPKILIFTGFLAKCAVKSAIIIYKII
jgi:hypothetical protein